MTTLTAASTLERIRLIRNDRALVHQLAISGNDLGELTEAIMTTSGMIGQTYAWNYGLDYDVSLTPNYLRKMAHSHLLGLNDGLGSATSALLFASREFGRQNPGRRWTVTWSHHTSGRPRREHLDADGMTVPVAQSFGISPAMGSPGCGCTADVGQA